jgi:hypothetical protein
MDEHLWQAGRARGQQDPFRFVAPAPLGVGGRDCGAVCHEASDIRSPGLGCGAVRHDGVHGRVGDDGRNTLDRQIGRTKNEPARNSIQLDQRQRRRELILSREKY